MISDILNPKEKAVPIIYEESYFYRFTNTYLDWYKFSADLDRYFSTLKCKTSLKSFKTAYTDQLPQFSCSFTIRIIRGSNFKIGISEHTHFCDEAFSDYPGGKAFYSIA